MRTKKLFVLYLAIISSDFLFSQQAILFKTEGSSFAPLISLNQEASVLWTFSDGTTSSELNPKKDFGTISSRYNSLVVTPWNAVEMINIGYDASDEGWYLPLVPDQKVSEIQNMHLVKDSLKFWCSSYNLLDSLVFDDFTNLQDIECYHSDSLKYVSLKNTPRLRRLCLEDGQILSLDISESPALEDLRSALNNYTFIRFSESTEEFYHICVRDNPEVTNDSLFAHMERFPNISELFIWNMNQSGPFKLAGNNATREISIMAGQNRYTSIDLSGTLQNENGHAEVYFDQNPLTSVNIRGCKQIKVLSLGWNEMSADLVTSVLEQLDSLGTFNGRAYLPGNQTPTFNGMIHKRNLENRGWQVIINGPWIKLFGNDSEILNKDSFPSINDLTDFGVVKVGDSAAHEFKIENDGTMLLSLNGVPVVKILEAGETNFKLIQTPENTVAPWIGSANFSLQFSPQSNGLKTANIVIENDGVDNKNPYVFTIQGIGEGGSPVNVLNQEKNSFRVFPNPCNSFITIQNSSVFVSTHLELISSDGKKYPLGKIESSMATINLPKLPSGSYIMHIYNNEESIFRKLRIQQNQ